MNIEAWAGLAAVGSFVLGVVVAVASLRRRDKEELQAAKAEALAGVRAEVAEHLSAEHTRDSEGRTLRERIGLIEAKCAERHPGGKRP